MDNIFKSLLSPEEAMMAIQAQQRQDDKDMAGGNVINQLARNAGRGFGGAINKGLGRDPNQNHPLMKMAQAQKGAAQGVDTQTPQGLMKLAQNLEAVGQTQQALKIRDKAVELAKVQQEKEKAFETELRAKQKHALDMRKGIKDLAGGDPTKEEKLFAAAQENPKFAEWLLTQNKSKATNVSISDVGNNVPLSKTSNNKVQEELITLRDAKVRLEGIKDRYKEEYLEVPAKFGNLVTKLREKYKVGNPLTEDERVKLEEFSAWRSEALDNINQYIKYITGAQMSVQEAARLRKSMPDPGEGLLDGDAPSEFTGKLNRRLDLLKATELRYEYLLKHGIKVDGDQNFSEQDANKYRIDDFKDAMKAIEDGKDREAVMNRLAEAHGIK